MIVGLSCLCDGRVFLISYVTVPIQTICMRKFKHKFNGTDKNVIVVCRKK